MKTNQSHLSFTNALYPAHLVCVLFWAWLSISRNSHSSWCVIKDWKKITFKSHSIICKKEGVQIKDRLFYIKPPKWNNILNLKTMTCALPILQSMIFEKNQFKCHPTICPYIYIYRNIYPYHVAWRIRISICGWSVYIIIMYHDGFIYQYVDEVHTEIWIWSIYIYTHTDIPWRIHGFGRCHCANFGRVWHIMAKNQIYDNF